MNLSNFNLSFIYSSITSQSHPLLTTTSFKSGYFCYRTTSTAIPMNETNKKKNTQHAVKYFNYIRIFGHLILRIPQKYIQ